ncbi:MAG: amidohydrolase [Candidatus Delongbacteria bacterium]|jgi:amidohydrolase|nr:amidohydrolase [Candidatus Delongbacteria bacterium]
MLNLIKIRKEIHSNPELSGKEVNTVKYLKNILNDLQPDKMLEIAGSLIVVFNGDKKRKVIAFRADIDALPIQELNPLKYASKKPNIAHLCGHDGHTAILLGLAEKVSKNKSKEGSIVFIFQSAEETGQGAKALMENKKFRDLKINKIYGFHNIPSFKLGSLLLKSGTFASGSIGMTVKLVGRSSHASEPEKGISPIFAVNKVLSEIEKLNSSKKYQNSGSFATVVGINAGDKAFGTSPSNAEIYLTIRSQNNNTIEEIIERIKKAAQIDPKLVVSFKFTEEFLAVDNNKDIFKSMKQHCKRNEIEFQELDKPFPWSEDFGYYTEKIKGFFIGIGSGVNRPHLHNPNYDFPDEIIEKSVKTLYLIYETM